MRSLVFIYLFISVCDIAWGLRRVNIGMVSSSAFITEASKDVDEPELVSPTTSSFVVFSTESPPPPPPFILSKETAFRVDSQAEVNYNKSQSSSQEGSVTTTYNPPTKPKKKRKKKSKLRKVLVKPRGGKSLKDTYQKLKPYRLQMLEAQAEYDATTPQVVIEEAVITDQNTGASYTQSDLTKLCEETTRIGSTFGIKDISTFAGNNCPLIRMYYPNVTCEQITIFLKYCETTGALQTQ